jgi:hypothetical protein
LRRDLIAIPAALELSRVRHVQTRTNRAAAGDATLGLVTDEVRPVPSS